MAEFESKADLAVRQAVDAYVEGRVAKTQVGELLFETKNSRYRVVDAVLTAAPDSILLGAELVGWLLEGASPTVKIAWQPDCRAVFVDRKRGRHIVVTSRVKMCSQVQPAASGSSGIQAGSTAHPPPAARAPAMFAAHAPVAAAPHAWRPLSHPPREVTSTAPAPAVRVIPRPPPIPARRSTDPLIVRRAGPFHPTPTRTNEPPAASDHRAAHTAAASRPPALRPLPFPTPPMRRETISGQVSSAPHGHRALPPMAPLPMAPLPMAPPPVQALAPWGNAAAASPEPQPLHPRSEPLTALPAAPAPRWTKTVPLADAHPHPRSEPRAALPSAPTMVNAGFAEHHAPLEAPLPSLSLSLARPVRPSMDPPPSVHPRARQRGVALR